MHVCTRARARVCLCLRAFADGVRASALACCQVLFRVALALLADAEDALLAAPGAGEAYVALRAHCAASHDADALLARAFGGRALGAALPAWLPGGGVCGSLPMRRIARARALKRIDVERELVDVHRRRVEYRRQAEDERRRQQVRARGSVCVRACLQAFACVCACVCARACVCVCVCAVELMCVCSHARGR